ncbi:MAG: hypothetical protein QHI38_12425 [Armatimonadota bacterium]|nr:hypothetical protein [Armatimonadota bacterium]
MKHYWKKFLAISSVLMLASVCAIGWAAPAKQKPRVFVKSSAYASGLRKLYVPANIISGSLVTKGRVFYRSSVPETTLAGIRLGRPAAQILAKWGNPTRITVGTATGEAETAQAQPTPSGLEYIPPPGGGTTTLPTLLSPLTSTLGLGRMGSSYPALPSFAEPMAPTLAPQAPTTGAPGQPTTGKVTRVLRQEEVTWTYDLPNGITLEFIITDGVVTQITVGGQGPWALSKTRTGLQLGDTYKLVLWVMGFPDEPHKYVGRFLRVSYINKNRTLFTFLNKRVVGITIALVQEEVRESVGETQ